MEEFITYIVGARGCVHFMAMTFFALVGATIQLTAEVKSRDGNHPSAWSWKYLLTDNKKRLFNTLLMVVIMIRFPLAFLPEDLTAAMGDDGLFFTAVAIGYSLDYLSRILKKKFSFLKTETNGS